MDLYYFTKKLFNPDWALSFSGFLHELAMCLFFAVLIVSVLFLVLELSRRRYSPAFYAAAILCCALPWYGGALWVVLGLLIFSLMFGKYGGKIAFVSTIGIILSVVLLVWSSFLAQFVGARPYPILQALYQGPSPQIVWPHDQIMSMANDESLTELERYAVAVQARLSGALSEADSILSSLDESLPFVQGEKGNLFFLRGEYEKARDVFSNLSSKSQEFKGEALFNLSKTNFELLLSNESTEAVGEAQKLKPEMTSELQRIEQEEGVRSPRSVATFLPSRGKLFSFILFEKGFFEEANLSMQSYAGKLPVWLAWVALGFIGAAALFAYIFIPREFERPNRPNFGVFLIASLFPGGFLIGKRRVLIPLIAITTFSLAVLGFLNENTTAGSTAYLLAIAVLLVVISLGFALFDWVNNRERYGR